MRKKDINTNRKSDWWIVKGGALLLVILIFVQLLNNRYSSTIQTVVLALTAEVILWYTVETMRLRRDAEIRAERDREPHIYFEIEQRDDELPQMNVSYPFRFKFINHSANSALARVRLRLIFQQAAVLSANGAYNGQQTWEITPFFQISGWFDLNEMIRCTLGSGGANVNADYIEGDMVLNLQLDLYWPDGRCLGPSAKEYRIRIAPSNTIPRVTFWPEVATSLSMLECPERLPISQRISLKHSETN